VGDVIERFFHGCYERLDAAEHLIEQVGQLVQLVATPALGHPRVHVAGNNDRLNDLGKMAHGPQRSKGQETAAGQTDEDHADGHADDRFPVMLQDLFAILDFFADLQQSPRRQTHGHHFEHVSIFGRWDVLPDTDGGFVAGSGIKLMPNFRIALVTDTTVIIDNAAHHPFAAVVGVLVCIELADRVNPMPLCDRRKLFQLSLNDFAVVAHGRGQIDIGDDRKRHSKEEETRPVP
jgi:hypothetical protein